MTTSQSRRFWISLAAVALLLVLPARPAQAIDLASVGIRVFDADFQQVGGINVLITYASGQYPVEPLLITTEAVGLVWNAVPPNLYAVVALDGGFEPIPESQILLNAPPGAHDIVVNLLLPPVCPADLDGDEAVNAADLALLLGAWGPNPGHDADVNNDEQVDAADLAILLGAWGSCTDT